MNKEIKKIEQETKELLQFNNVVDKIQDAKTPIDLLEPLKIVARKVEFVKKLKDEIKKITADPKAIIKELTKQIDQLESDAKEKFLETYQRNIAVVAKKSRTGEVKTNDDGEVEFKEKVIDNKGKGMFSYTPAKTESTVDYSQITIDKFPSLFKEVKTMEIDNDALAAFDYALLPKKEKLIPEKVGIRYTAILKMGNDDTTGIE